MESLAAKERGLILVTGPTGSGKSTTLAALIDHINLHYAKNIITIEDPIEFLHKHKKSLVVQREVGLDTDSFYTGLKYALRQDPDVIMVGEMRDRETVEAALMAAQTGHLVLSTLHTLDAWRTINRIIDFFPLHEHRQVRVLLAESLLGILSQRLLPKADGQGRVLALEILIATPYVRELLKDEEKMPQIKEAMMEGSLYGMRTFDQHLVELYTEGLISLEDALSAATSPHEFRLLLTKATGADLLTPFPSPAWPRRSPVGTLSGPPGGGAVPRFQRGYNRAGGVYAGNGSRDLAQGAGGRLRGRGLQHQQHGVHPGHPRGRRGNEKPRDPRPLRGR